MHHSWRDSRQIVLFYSGHIIQVAAGERIHSVVGILAMSASTELARKVEHESLKLSNCRFLLATLSELQTKRT